MSIILALASKYWKQLAGIAVIVAIVLAGYLYMHHLYSTIDQQAHKITELSAANAVLDENNKTLTQSLKSNAEAIDKMAKGADATNKAFAGLNTSVKSQTTTLEAKLAQILQDKKPQTCDETIQYLIDAAKGYAK